MRHREGEGERMCCVVISHAFFPPTCQKITKWDRLALDGLPQRWKVAAVYLLTWIVRHLVLSLHQSPLVLTVIKLTVNYLTAVGVEALLDRVPASMLERMRFRGNEKKRNANF